MSDSPFKGPFRCLAEGLIVDSTTEVVTSEEVCDLLNAPPSVLLAQVRKMVMAGFCEGACRFNDGCPAKPQGCDMWKGSCAKAALDACEKKGGR